MFSGLVRALGVVVGVAVLDQGLKLGFVLNRDLSLRLGDSMCCSGVCLTVVLCSLRYVEVEAWRSSLCLSNLASLARFDVVNVEAPASLNSLMHGHLVRGHVVSVVKLVKAVRSGSVLMLKVASPSWLSSGLVAATSVCLNGVSLTLTKAERLRFDVLLIRFSVLNTSFKTIGWNAELNFE
ncbi:hypothetical protein AAHH87_00050 [Candidatus Hodgkinia cicadicola]